MPDRSTLRVWFSVLAVSIVLFGFFSAVPDITRNSEARTALKAQGMCDQGGNMPADIAGEGAAGRLARRAEPYLVPVRAGIPHLTKPPLYYWMECVGAKLWHDARHGGASGSPWISPWLARFPAVLFAVALVVMVVLAASRTSGPFAGFCAGLALLGAPFAVTGLIEANIDGPFAVAASAAFFSYFSLVTRSRGRLMPFLAWTGFTTLAFYFKGPVYFQFFLPILAGVLAYRACADRRSGVPVSRLVTGLLRTLAVTVLGLLVGVAVFLLYYWLVSRTPTMQAHGGLSHLSDYFRGEVLDNRYGDRPDHGAPVTHIFVLLVGGATLPFLLTLVIGATGLVSLFRSGKGVPADDGDRAWRAFLWIWLVGGFLVLSFTPAKQYRYTLPLLPPLALLVGMAFREYVRSGRPAGFSVLFPLLLAFGSLACPALISYAVLVRARHLHAMYGSVLSPEGLFDALLVGLWLVLVGGSAAFLLALAAARDKAAADEGRRRRLVVMLLVSALLASVAGNMVRLSQKKSAAPRYLVSSVRAIPGLRDVATYRCSSWMVWHAFGETSLPSISTSPALHRVLDEATNTAVILRPDSFLYRAAPGEGIEILVLHAASADDDPAEPGDAVRGESGWLRVSSSDNIPGLPQRARVRFIGADGTVSEPLARAWTVHCSMPCFAQSRMHTVLADYESD